MIFRVLQMFNGLLQTESIKKSIYYQNNYKINNNFTEKKG